MNIQSHMKINRQMAILATIRKLQFATRRHVMSVHNMGGIRNANRIMGDLKPYLSKTTQGKEYVYYLNKEGHALFGDDGKVVSRGKLAHALLRNEAWLHLFCPDDWQIETDIRYIKNKEKKKIVPDVKFRDEEGILHAVEVDRSQKMKVNEEKLKKYEELTQIYKKKHNGKMPVIHFFTVTKYREKKLEELAAKYEVFVKVYVIEEF
ncbi:protein involved in plasmid replication-relaxation [Bacillus thuringiensis]|uniref:Protein involved in plasmid replication-relaxation n=1 Tax=Bacillus thuringiensis TaxID=1428 RepID=A0A4R4BDF3_BACTU|nr:replication-relaxation family protein [Bacillus thuringiensis]TCW53664.1 protein involved in plasmid replication-relaxation [Bacillus thuringiensis]TCW53871.1 protein involved in plasmid replication-relaxation [Bacillus thuringiensis]